jgi:hypothetical protein
MTDRRFVGLLLIPAAATVFGASVAWAAANDPLAAAAPAPTPSAVPAAPPAPADAAEEQRMADLAVQIEAARARIAELQTVLAVRDAAAAQAAAAAAAAPAPRASTPQRSAPAAAQPAPAPQPAPPTQVTTKASG